MGWAEYWFLGGTAGLLAGLAAVLYVLEAREQGSTPVFAVAAMMWFAMASGVTPDPMREIMVIAAGLPYPAWVWRARRRGHAISRGPVAPALMPALVTWGAFAILARSALFAGLAGGAAFAAIVEIAIEGWPRRQPRMSASAAADKATQPTE